MRDSSIVMQIVLAACDPRSPGASNIVDHILSGDALRPHRRNLPRHVIHLAEPFTNGVFPFLNGCGVCGGLGHRDWREAGGNLTVLHDVDGTASLADLANDLVGLSLQFSNADRACRRLVTARPRGIHHCPQRLFVSGLLDNDDSTRSARLLGGSPGRVIRGCGRTPGPDRGLDQGPEPESRWRPGAAPASWACRSPDRRRTAAGPPPPSGLRSRSAS